MSDETMKAKCLAKARAIGGLDGAETDIAWLQGWEDGCERVADAIAAIQVEPGRTIEPPGCPAPGACSCLREADGRGDETMTLPEMDRHPNEIDRRPPATCMYFPDTFKFARVTGDRTFLHWIYMRLNLVHHEPFEIDYMDTLRQFELGINEVVEDAARWNKLPAFIRRFYK